MERKIQTPFTRQLAESLRAGDSCLISGVIYTARDAAHKRLCQSVARGEALPFDPADSIIYYVGPTPAKPGQAIGSAGPTTSYRMDDYTPTMLSLGARGMIGKGVRGSEVVAAMKENGGVYFAALGGCGALLSKCVKKCQVIAYPDLGAEAIHRLEVEDFPAIVVIDSQGNDLYSLGKQNYLNR